MATDLTRGSPLKQILYFSIPYLIGNLFQQLYNAFDAWCVGYFINDDALAAVSSSGSLIFMMVSFFCKSHTAPHPTNVCEWQAVSDGQA